MPENLINPRPHTELTEDRYEKILEALALKPIRLRGLLAPLHPADVADVLERMPLKQREKFIPYLPEDAVGDILLELEEGARDHLLHILEPEQVVEAVTEMESDDIADIVQNLEENPTEEDAETAERVRDVIDTKEKRLIKYDRDTAGGLMQVEVVTALETQLVKDVLRYLRKAADDLPQNPGTVFVLNESRKLLGTVSLARLVQCPLNTPLSEIMRQKPLSLQPETPNDDVVKMFEKYNMHNCAVVNKRGQLLGRVTIDDVLDTVLESHERALKRAAGLDEKEDIFAPISTTTRHRLPWLLVNLVTAIMASLVIALFQDDIQRLVALAVLMPIVASMGGNAGTQTMTVLVRGMATGQVTKQNAFALLRKELAVGSLNGLALGVIVAFGTTFIYGDPYLGLVIFCATIANHLFAAISGHGIPMVLKRFKYDPAISSGVLVSMVTDVGGFFVFLGLAALLLL